jgi:hypothetical protein
MPTFPTLEGAFQHVNTERTQDRACGDQARLWTILVGWSGKHYVYFSDRNHGQQMHHIGKTILEYSGHYGRDLPHGRDLAVHLADFFEEKAGPMIRFGGHSEESMIRDFDRVLGKEGQPAAAGANMRIINSDSPCTTQDRGGSNNLPGWPPSCMEKLVTLANKHPNIGFSVFYYRRYGKLDEGAKAARKQATTELGKKAPAEQIEALAERMRNEGVSAHLQGVMRNSGAGADQAPQGRITISPFDPALTLVAKEFPNI